MPASEEPAGSPAELPAGAQVPADRAPLRIAVFVGGLVVALIAGFGLGRMTGPAPSTGSTPIAQVAAGPTHSDPPGTAPHVHTTAGVIVGTTAGDSVGGLSVSSGGYTLVPESTTFTAGELGAAKPFRFQVRGPDGTPVTGFAVVNDKPMHLIVVRRDLTGYQHLHPTMAADGTWSVDLALPDAGSWRVYADFAVARPATAAGPAAGNPASGNPASGKPGLSPAATGPLALTLGTDLTVAGDYRPRAVPGPARESTVDGLTVTYEGTAQVGAVQPLLLRVSRNGTPVTGDLQRYLGSYGHLVMLREGDLGYLHVHPEQQLAGGAVKFWVAAPSRGRYRTYFDFQLGGVVRTAEFSMSVP